MNHFHKTIRISLLLFVFLCTGLSANAQDTRDIALKVVNKRGRPVSNIVVQSRKTDKVGMTDRTGLFVFSDMADNDTISVNLPKYGKTHIPVTGMEYIEVKVRSSMHYSYNDNSGQSVMITKDMMGSNSTLDVQAMLKRRTYSSLAELLKGQVPGLVVSTTGGTASARIRGVSSLNSSNEALVVVDGRSIGTLNDVNSWVNIHDVKTIEVVKDGAGWGVRGANGVILIKTR